MMKRNISAYSLLLLTLLFPAVLQASNYVIINQVMYDTPLNEMTNISPSSNGEFIELYNAGEDPVALDGWSIKGTGQSEKWVFSNTTIPSKGYLVIACRRGQGNTFQLGDLYGTLIGDNPVIVYQNKIILVNDGETLTLCNAQNDTVDYMYYGKPDKTFKDLLHASNEDSISGDQCVSLHRKWVEFDAEGKVVPNISEWATGLVSFGENILPYDTYYEHSLTDGQLLPDGSNGADNENYILTITPMDPAVRINVENGNFSVSSAIRTQTTIQYLDGLGRANETIALGVTPEGDDMVSIVENNGNVSRQWLPVIMQAQGQRKDISEIQAQAIMDYGERPFAETKRENQNRQVKQYHPGSNYEAHPATQTNEFNDADEVLLFTVKTNGDLHSSGTSYNAATLYKTTVADEDGKTVVTFTDKQGRKIMDRHGDSEVYYVYDDMGYLRYMLPNISSKLTSKDCSLDDKILKASAYCYQYDSIGHMVYKRLPGCEPQYMVYDQIGQLVLSQDGNQRLNEKWTMCAYDSLGRSLYTAEIKLTQTHEELIRYFADKWQVEHYGNNHSFPLTGTGYASRLLKNNNIRLLTINYYDDYDYLDILPTSLRQALRYKQESGYGKRYENTIGLLTGTRVYNLSEEGYTAASYFYDEKGHMIQSRSVRSSDEYTTVSHAEYLFDGSVAQQMTVQGKEGEEGSVQEHYRYKYDHAGRALEVKYQLNDDPEIILSQFSYDEMGRLARNLLHNKKDTVRYSFDMRNMLTETSNKHFSERLYYADNLPEFATACHNGNISASTIRENGVSRSYSYSYDNQNRLTSVLQETKKRISRLRQIGELFTYDPSGNIISLKRIHQGRSIDNLEYSYGDDGNQLLTIDDNGTDADVSNCIEYHDEAADSVEMFYDSNGNLTKDADRQIDSIVYNILNLPDTIKFHNGTVIVNCYDAAGRKYRSATYTIPETQGTSNHEVAAYAYDSVQSGCDYSIANYSGNIETHYTKRGEEVTTSRTIHNAIGYWKDSAYYHFIKDHLGNVCAVVKSETDELVQSTIYYASGVPTPLSKDRGEQPYLYNGKEFVEAPSVEYNVYDYGFRGYYAPIGRFTSVDPLAEQTPWQSPYVYANNNFANRIDYMGLFGTSPDDGFGSGSGSGMDGFQHDDDEFTIGGDGIGGYGDYEWGIWSWSIFGEHLGILGMQIRSYIIVDENYIVLDADLSSPDKGIYKVERTAYERYMSENPNGDGLLWSKLCGTQLGVHQNMRPGTVLTQMPLDVAWFDLRSAAPVTVLRNGSEAGTISSIQMSQEDYLRLLNEENPAGYIINPYTREEYMSRFNSFEQGMMMSPIVRGCAAGGLVGTLGLSGGPLWSATKGAYTWAVTTGWQTFTSMPLIQFVAGFVEGFTKAVANTGPCTPSFYSSPTYLTGVQAGSQFYDKIIK